MKKSIFIIVVVAVIAVILFYPKSVNCCINFCNESELKYISYNHGHCICEFDSNTSNDEMIHQMGLFEEYKIKCEEEK